MLEKHDDYYDGICVTGGEPTLHDLAPFFRKVKDAGFQVKLDTNGTNPSRLKGLIEEELVDYVAMDYKVPMEEMEKVLGGSFSAEKVGQSVKMLREGSVDHEFRTTVVPGIHDRNVLMRIAKELEGSDLWVVQKFRGKDANGNPTVSEENAWLLDQEPFEDEFYLDVVKEAKKLLGDVKLRG